MITCVFEDYRDEARTANVISFMAKRARGKMARYIIEKRIDDAESLKGFDRDRYAFVPDRSTDERFVFGRAFVPAWG